MKLAWMSTGLLSFFLFFFAAPIFAQDDGTVIITPSPTPYLYVTYEMPYPGILPDNPFYPLKTLRDKVVGFLITDPGKKATFDLLQADKRFQAGVMLYEKDKKKKELAFSTISKAHNYLDLAIDKAREAKATKIVTDVDSRIHQSLNKQTEILRNLKAVFPQDSQQINNSLKRVEALQQQANEIIPQGRDK